MIRLTHATNLAIATLWADLLTRAGIESIVQRQFTSSIAGEIPPDQCLPEVWVIEDSQLAQARALLFELQHPRERRWVCRNCDELIEGPFEQCWKCGANMPGS